jgi:O-antigen ligase
MFGLAVALLLGAFLQRRTEGTSTYAARWIVAGLAVAAMVTIARVDPAAILGRVEAAPVSAAGRLLIWRDTIPIVRDFWLTGTGAGTYETAMLVYQRASPGVRFNQAHNHYLQLAAEGGLLLCVPVAMALWHTARGAARRLAADHSGMYWIRAGAICGLAGVAAQSVWETGLTTPANALLAAIVAAIALHVPVKSGRRN